jgi:N-6 DNA Methylase
MPRIQPIDTYLDEVSRIRSLPGTRETSYYPAVANLLNQIGGALKPKVYCLHHPSGGDGIPDFGLFEQTLFRRGESPEWRAGIAPDRGVVEVKGADHRIQTLLDSDQVRERYLPAYGLVLATNLWQYRLVDEAGCERERFDLANEEAGFWRLVRGPRSATLESRFTDFLQRCLLARAPLARPADVAFFLASYAREALTRLEERASLPALAALRCGMEQALGIGFGTRNGEHLFRSTFVQTLFYGIFSAWVAHARSGGTQFDWRGAQWSMTVPVARFLFQQAATPEALEPLELVPLLDAAAETLGRVDRAAFFTAFDDTQAVQYFYEPFLEYFDPELRRALGVWYTPREIVTYMVERIDRVLRTELGRDQGLADTNVWVLDPCCGTGSYVVEVLRRIRRTLEEQGLGDLVGERLKRAAMTRVAGFEIMTAPFTIAHWQVGEELRRAGAPLAQGERAAVYLTNALTGWNPAEETGATDVKQNQPILVVLGNPPYNAFAGISPASEGGLVEPYKQGLRDRWGVRKFNLDDLYIRFFRVAERRVAERTGQGIVCFISNYSWLSYGSFVVMRERLLSEFDGIWIDNLNGDSRETGKLTPAGDPDPSVFSTPMNREGIRVGTCITTLVRRAR